MDTSRNTHIGERNKNMKSNAGCNRNIESLLATKSNFLSSVSHEIRTPVNVIVGFSNLLADPSYNQNQKEFFINEINNNSKLLLKIIDDLIATAKINSEEIIPDFRSCQIDEFYKQLNGYISENLSHLFKYDKNITIKELTGSKSAIFITDPELLNKAVFDLIVNVLKIDSEGLLSFNLKAEEGKVLFLIHLNESTTRINAESNRKANSNKTLKHIETIEKHGLAATDKIIRTLGGKLKIKSILGKETSFNFAFPLLVEEPA